MLLPISLSVVVSCILFKYPRTQICFLTHLLIDHLLLIIKGNNIKQLVISQRKQHKLSFSINDTNSNMFVFVYKKHLTILYFFIGFIFVLNGTEMWCKNNSYRRASCLLYFLEYEGVRVKHTN